jgi:hypothetical protein
MSWKENTVKMRRTLSMKKHIQGDLFMDVSTSSEYVASYYLMMVNNEFEWMLKVNSRGLFQEFRSSSPVTFEIHAPDVAWVNLYFFAERNGIH